MNMELEELQNIWIQYDKKISDNTRLNKKILKKILMAKPEKRLNWIRIKAGFRVFSPVILVLLVAFTDMKFSLTTNFYIGLCLFLSGYLISYIWDVRYFLLIRKIDFSETILSIRKKVTELEKYKIKTTRIRYMIMPVGIVGILLMLIHKLTLNAQTIVFFALMIIAFIASIYYTFNFSILEQFRVLNKEIAEIENLEKE